jgi:hypothetical protein
MPSILEKKKKKKPMSSSSSSSPSSSSSSSLCAKCVLNDVGAAKWKRSRVEDDDQGQTWSIIECDVHGESRQLACSDSGFARRLQASSLGEQDSLVDVEDSHLALGPLGDGAKLKQLPFQVELGIFDARASEWLDDEQIGEQIDSLMRVYGARGMRFVCKVVAPLCTDIEALNAKVHAVLRAMDRADGDATTLLPLLLLHVTFDRLILVSRLDDTVLLHRRVFPSLRMALERGQEAQSLREMQRLVKAMRQFSSIQLVVSMAVSAPLPDLSALLAYVRSMPTLVRFVIFEYQRPAKRVFAASSESSEASSSASVPLDGLDAMTLIREIERCSERDGLAHMSRDDFVSSRVGMVLEPFLKHMGYGRFNVRAASLCAYGTVLVNGDAPPLNSLPLTRLFDIERFFRQVYASLDKLTRDASIGWLQAQKLRWAIRKCRAKHSPIASMPDVLDYLVDADKADAAAQFVGSLQFVVVHHHMDIASTDFGRRALCPLVKMQKGNRFVAQCTQCL